MKIMFRIGVSEDSVERVQRLKLEGGSLSKAHPASSDAEGLNAPFGGMEILIGLKIIAATFTAGAAALTFFRELRASLRPGETVLVESADGSKRLKIGDKTPDSDLEKFVG